MQNHYEEITATGAAIVAVSTDDLAGAERSVELFGAAFPILYTSRDSAVPESYGVYNLFGDGLASASVFIVTENNEIAWKSIGTTYTHQVSSDRLIAELTRF